LTGTRHALAALLDRRPARIGIEVAAKVLALAVFGSMLCLSLWGAWQNGRAAIEAGGAARWAETADRLAMASFLALVLIAYVRRPLPSRRASGVLPRVAAFVGGFLITPLALLPFLVPVPALVLGLRVPALSFAGLALTLLGHCLSAAAIGALGRSFSLVPEARGLVTRGAYRLVRHPVYVAEEVAALGVLLGNVSVLATAIVVVHAAVQLYRIRNEERVLAAEFPGYREYATRVGMLVPGLRWPRGWW
jgi:protein-S-isoprenylcysteine O-methyltransferase Ste14